jgi:hypothetical protein
LTDSRELRSERSELTSFSQFVQDLIVGAVRRHTFTQWELELLLDLQLARVRKSARPDLLRRYLKAVHQQYARGLHVPLRFSTFMDREAQQRAALCNPVAVPTSSDALQPAH